MVTTTYWRWYDKRIILSTNMINREKCHRFFFAKRSHKLAHTTKKDVPVNGEKHHYTGTSSFDDQSLLQPNRSANPRQLTMPRQTGTIRF